jgi:FkbM family methyltransferase
MQNLVHKAQPRLEHIFERMRAEGRETCVHREKAAFDSMIAPFTDLVLFGAGPLGRSILEGLRKAGVNPLAFADNNPNLWGSWVDGLAILPPQESADRYGDRAGFVVTIYNGSSARTQLQGLGCRKVLPFVPLLWKYFDVFIPHCGIDLPDRIAEQGVQIEECYSILADDISRREFCGQLEWRYWLDYAALAAPLSPQDIYFPSDIVSVSSREVFVDCGAFDGDSIRSFLAHRNQTFSHIVGLEPDPDNRRRLCEFISHLPADTGKRISVLPYAAGNENKKVTFRATETAGSKLAAEGWTTEVECHRLDDLPWAHTPTFIKMDIEGAEPEALAGAAHLLQRYHPVLAVCVYHRNEHLWRIPNLIHSISGDYNLFLRRYAEECWEMVCYAVPADRLRRPASGPADLP